MDLIQTLKNRLKDSYDFAVKEKEDLYRVSWNYQEGVLISYNEAKLILDLINNLAIHDVSNCKTEPKLGKLETELGKLQKVHGEIVKYFDVHSGCDSFKFKDGAVYRVKLERSFGKATLD